MNQTIPTLPAGFERLFFSLWVLVLTAFFFWSRIDPNDRIYFIGDANWIIEMIRLMLESGNWDANATRLFGRLEPDPTWQAFSQSHTDPNGHYYNLAGYIVVGASICKVLYTLGFDSWSIQQILHAANVVFQALTVWLLFLIGRQIMNRSLGLLAATFYVLLPLAIMEAHYARPESWLNLLATFTLYCALQFQRKPYSFSIAIGVLLGLSFSAKFSQLFLGLIPAILLLDMMINGQRYQQAFTCGAIILFCMVIATAVNTPFILQNFSAHLTSIAGVFEFHRNPLPPYLSEDYSYLKQLGVFASYFLATIGLVWCLCFCLGIYALLCRRLSLEAPFTFTLATCLPILVLIFYFAFNKSFFERSYSSLEGAIALISATGFYFLYLFISKLDKPAVFRHSIITLLFAITIYPALKLNTAFVSQYIYNNGVETRLAFQKELRADFAGFWIKNVHETNNYLNKLPERAPKKPRIYAVKDLNEPWTQRFIENLGANGFIQIAEFRSEFFGMPPNNLTIYHEASRYYYFVREDEWPKNKTQHYFRANY